MAEVLWPQIPARVYCPPLPALPEIPVGRLSPTTSLPLTLSIKRSCQAPADRTRAVDVPQYSHHRWRSDCGASAATKLRRSCLAFLPGPALAAGLPTSLRVQRPQTMVWAVLQQAQRGGRGASAATKLRRSCLAFLSGPASAAGLPAWLRRVWRPQTMVRAVLQQA